MQCVHKQWGVLHFLNKGEERLCQIWVLGRPLQEQQSRPKQVQAVKVTDMSNKRACFQQSRPKPNRLKGMRSWGSYRKEVSCTQPTTSWRVRKSLEKFGKVSALSQVNTQIPQYFYLPKLGDNTKMWLIPFTPSNSHQMLMPSGSPTATVPKIISFQRSGIWSSLKPISQYFNCVKLFICSAI